MTTHPHEEEPMTEERSVALVPIESDGGQDLALEFVEHLDSRWRLAKYMVASGMVPQKRPEEAIVVMLKGYELGVPPMMAAANIHVIAGRPTLSADLMCALAAQRAGVTYKVETETDEECVIVFKRPGWEPYMSRYTMADARSEGLADKDNWRKMKRPMLAARAKSRGSRMIAPDVLAGIYAYEEIEAVPESATGTKDLNEMLRKGAAPAVDHAGPSTPGAAPAAATDTGAGEPVSHERSGDVVRVEAAPEPTNHFWEKPWRLDEPPPVLEYLADQLAAINRLDTLDRLEAAERAKDNRKTALDRIGARRRVLENGKAQADLTMQAATDQQTARIKALLNEREVEEGAALRIYQRLARDGFNEPDAADVISMLEGLPAKSAVTA